MVLTFLSQKASKDFSVRLLPPVTGALKKFEPTESVV